ncbi:single-stranded DNA-binding protein [Ottowia thiooxydans]|uniref:single-stranded DNA-binding protein n=1 Tax=Ottowia thiooxydans TaxID=219182 RepID=UPI000427B528|nr:single-stranded DNA-binding protein [Ottowia thiooxydans]
MASTNMAVLTGYLGTDPEKRYFPDGTPQTTFRVATTERWKDKDTGEQKSHTEWHNIVTQKGTAEFAATYLKKGDSVQVIGKLRTRKWADRNGVDRYTTEIRSSDVQSLERKPADKAAPTTPPHQDEAPAEATTDSRGFDGPDEDDIPF